MTDFMTDFSHDGSGAEGTSAAQQRARPRASLRSLGAVRSGGIPLTALKPLRWSDERDLRAHFNDELAGRMGLRSNLGPLINQLRLGCRVQAEHAVFDIDEQVLEEAGRSREVLRRLRQLPWRHVRVLKALYGPRGTAPTLEAFTDALLGDLTPVVLIAPATKRAHEASRSTRELGDWLVRLADRVRTGKGGTLAYDRARAAILLADARGLVYEACRAYAETREVSRAA